MNKNIYANSDEKFVKATVVFSSEDKIYYDEACAEEVTLEDALNLFKKGLMLVSVDGGFKRPTGITVTEEGYEISYGGNGGGSGQEEFIITFTETDGNWSADKIFSDIETAVAAGKKVVAIVDSYGNSNKIEMKAYYPGEAAAFFGLVLFGRIYCMNIVFTSENTVDVVETYDFLPMVDSDSNGEVLTVHDGAWKARPLPTE